MLTTADVEQKTFSTALRGYDLDEVDDFLDEMVSTLRELTEQLEAAQAESGAAVSVVPVSAPEPAPKPVEEALRPEVDESAIGRALVAAQTAADKMLADAQDEANKIVDEAKGEADTWQAEKEAKKAETEAEISALAARVASVRSELSVLAGEVSEKLDDMDAVIEGRHRSELVFGSTDEPDEDQELGGDVSTGSSDSSAGDVDDVADGEDGTEGDESDDEQEAKSEDGGDELDEILNGVANDLQLGSDQSAEETSEEDEN